MQSKGLFSVVVLGGLSLGYGCHTLAGVHTDGVLDEGTVSSSSTGMAGAGGMGGTGGAAGTGGMGGAGGGGNCIPTDCVTGMCSQGACVSPNAVCAPSGAIFDIFGPGDFVDADAKMLVAHSSKAVYVAISDEGGPNPIFKVHSIDGDGSVANIVNCTASATAANMVSARASDTEFVIQGHLNGPNATMAEISFPTNDPEGRITGPCVEMPMPSWKECVNRINTEAFVRNGGVTKYVTTCADPVDSTISRVVIGGSDELTYTDIANGPNSDISLRTTGIAYVKNERVLFSGPDLVGEFYFRRESAAFAPQQIDFSGIPERQEAIFALVPEIEGQSVYVVGASAILPPKFDASLLGGLVTDVSQLATTPAQGFKEFVHMGSAEVSKLGTYGNITSDDTSYYAAIIPLAKKSVEMYWFTKKAESLIGGQAAYTVPATDSSTITRAAFVPLALQRLVVWREENAGAVSVRGQRFVCSY